MSSAELTASVLDISFLKGDQKCNEMKMVVIYSWSCLLQDSDPDSALLRAVLHCTLGTMPLKRAERVVHLWTTLQGVLSNKSQTFLPLWGLAGGGLFCFVLFFACLVWFGFGFKSEKAKGKKKEVFGL